MARLQMLSSEAPFVLKLAKTQHSFYTLSKQALVPPGKRSQTQLPAVIVQMTIMTQTAVSAKLYLPSKRQLQLFHQRPTNPTHNTAAAGVACVLRRYLSNG